MCKKARLLDANSQAAIPKKTSNPCPSALGYVSAFDVSSLLILLMILEIKAAFEKSATSEPMKQDTETLK